jgi:hypothetical protein
MCTIIQCARWRRRRWQEGNSVPRRCRRSGRQSTARPCPSTAGETSVQRTQLRRFAGHMRKCEPIGGLRGPTRTQPRPYPNVLGLRHRGARPPQQHPCALSRETSLIPIPSINSLSVPFVPTQAPPSGGAGRNGSSRRLVRRIRDGRPEKSSVALLSRIARRRRGAR